MNINSDIKKNRFSALIEVKEKKAPEDKSRTKFSNKNYSYSHKDNNKRFSKKKFERQPQHNIVEDKVEQKEKPEDILANCNNFPELFQQQKSSNSVLKKSWIVDNKVKQNDDTKNSIFTSGNIKKPVNIKVIDILEKYLYTPSEIYPDTDDEF